MQILPGPTNRTRDLVLPTACVTILTEYQTHSHNDTEILINALWHTSPSANNRHIKCHTIIFSYNILAIHPPPSHKKKYDMNDIWFKNDNNWNHFNNYTRKKIHSNIHLPRAKTLACHLEEAGHKKNLAYTLKNILKIPLKRKYRSKQTGMTIHVLFKDVST